MTQAMHQILVIEDEPGIRTVLRLLLVPVFLWLLLRQAQ